MRQEQLEVRERWVQQVLKVLKGLKVRLVHKEVEDPKER